MAYPYEYQRLIDEFYLRAYSDVLDQGAVGFVNSWVHRSLEIGFTPGDYFHTVVELGAGRGQHLGFVRHDYLKYIETDKRIDLLPSREARPPQLLERMEVDAQTMTGIDEPVDRIIATCLLPHLDEPEDALRRWRSFLKPGGVLSLHVTANPGLILRALRKVTTARKAAQAGFNYDKIYLREHRYTFTYLNRIIRDTFSMDDVSRRAFPLGLMPWNLSLWFVYQIRIR